MAVRHWTLLLVCASILGCKSPAQKPNVLVILVDDLGYNDLGFMGSEYYETPNIDRLASQGMVFTRGYAACQVCSPSRASLMTGLFPTRHGITDYIGAPEGEDWRRFKRHTPLLPANYQHHLPHELATLPEVFRQNGYTTFFAGKWHLGGEGEQSLPTDHGFDINKGGFHAGGPYTGGFFSPFNNPFLEDLPEEKGIHLSTKLAKETTQFLEKNREQPFLAYLAFYAVHAPIQTTEEKWKKYRDKAESMGISEEGFEMERVLPIRKNQDNPVYAGLVEHVDDAVGIVLSKLEELELADNTIIVFTSDNGGVASGDNYSTSIRPLRGGKGYQWEGGIRVPFVMKVPGLDHQGMKVDEPVSGIDLLPTLAELAGIQSPQNIDGQSLVPLLNQKEPISRPLYWHYPHYGNQGGEPSSIMIRNGYKLIYYWESGAAELYNLDDDIHEENDLSSSLPERVTTMQSELLAFLSATDAQYASADPQFNPDSLQMKLDYFGTELLERLETQRREMLDPDWQPNEDWWGSQ